MGPFKHSPVNPAILAASLLTAVALTGCGGGGGGSDDSSQDLSNGGGGSGSTPPSYSGPTSAAPVNRDTVLELSRSLIAAASTSEIADSFWIDVEPGSSSSKQSKDGSGGGKITVEVTSTGANSSQVVVEFKDFSEDGVTASGRIVQNVRRYEESDGNSYYSYTSGDQSFENFTLSTGGDTYVIHGTVEGAGPESRHHRLNLILVDQGESQQLKLQEFSTDKTLVSGYPYSYFNSEVSGTLYDSAQGKITISTERPMAEFGMEESRNYWRGSRNGLIRFQGDGEGGLFGLNATFATLLLDEDGDGQLETGNRVTWELLNNSDALATFHNSYAPVSNPGEPVSSRERLDTFVHGLYSHDADGNFLSYRWELVAKPADSTFELQHPNTPYFTFQPDLAGDYVFNLYVSDGENESRSTSSITVWENLTNETYSVEQLNAGLEVKALDTAQPAYALDATSGLNGPWDEDDVTWSSTTSGFDGETGLEENNHTPHNTVTSLSPFGHSFTASARGQDFYSSTTINSGDVPIVVSARVAGQYSPSSMSAAAADLNGDKAADIVSLYRVDNTQIESEIFLNNGDGTFARAESVPAGNKYLITGDLDGDGRAEIVSSDNQAMVLASQDSNGNYNTVTKLAFPESPCNREDYNYTREIAIEDVNGDDKNDLIALRACSELEYVYWLQGDSGLGEAVRIPLLTSWTDDASLADIDNDGREDAIAIYTDVYTDAEQVRIFYNQEEGFTETIVDTSFNTNVPGLAAADLTGNGFAEIVILNGGFLNILYRSDDGSFVENTEIAQFGFSGNNRQGVRFADLDGNGRTDLLLTDTYEAQAIMNQGDHNFTLNFLHNDFSPWEDASAGIADVNLDGHPDIVIPGSAGVVVGYGDLTYYGKTQD